MVEYLYDTKLKTIIRLEIKIEELKEAEIEYFYDNYSRPYNLIHLNKIYCDGSGYNGNESKSIFLIDDYKIDNGFNISIPHIRHSKVSYTNNEMEYDAILEAIVYIRTNESVRAITPCIILSDSQLVIRQINKQYKIRDKKLIKLNQQLNEHLRYLDENQIILFEWIPRTENTAGKILDALKLKR